MVSPADAWRKAISEVCRRSGRSRPFYEALAERKLGAYGRLQAIGLCIDIPRDLGCTPERVIAEFNECIAEMKLEFESAPNYLSARSYEEIGRLLPLLSPLSVNAVRADLMLTLGDAYDGGFEAALDKFIRTMKEAPTSDS